MNKKYKVKFLWNENEYDMMVEARYASDANNICKQMVKDIDGIDVQPIGTPVSYTHLTLPTKRIV